LSWQTNEGYPNNLKKGKGECAMNVKI